MLQKFFESIDKLAGKWFDWRTEQAVKNLPPELKELKLHKAEADERSWSITAFAPGIVAMADQASELLQYQNAKNYIQFDLMPRLDRGKPPIRVTIQWAHGESPSSKAARLENIIVGAVRDGVYVGNGNWWKEMCDVARAFAERIKDDKTASDEERGMTKEAQQ